MNVVVRARRPTDLPVLADLLAGQQPTSRYPFRWPLPGPVEQFLVRDGEQAAWVAVLDGVLAGHVSVGPVSGLGDAAEVFRTATGCPEPALVSVLFTSTAARGRGVGGALLDVAVGWAQEQGRVPVLDVVQRHSSALTVYRHRGWVEVGRYRFAWLPDEVPDVLLLALPPLPGLSGVS
ncbi:MAG: GNAT family N-acetyltransferase [Mycobacteriaceae bacterium]